LSPTVVSVLEVPGASQAAGSTEGDHRPGRLVDRVRIRRSLSDAHLAGLVVENDPAP
jgi:hypothetical protein